MLHPLHFRKAYGLLLVTLCATLIFTLFGPTAPAARASAENGCNDPRVSFPAPFNPLLLSNSEDTIFYSESNNLPSNQVRVVLESSGRVSWWKGLELSYPGRGIVATASTQDWNHGPNATTIFLDSMDPALLSIKLLKAKIFGIHTGMYCIDNLSSKRGKTLYFYWAWDGSN